MPNILLETLGGDRKSIRVAYYYDIPINKQLTGAVDSSREPARGTSTNLNQAGKDGLKAGTVYEFIRSFDIPENATGAQIRQAMLDDRTALAAVAEKAYTDAYKFIGQYYDGAAWGPA